MRYARIPAILLAFTMVAAAADPPTGESLIQRFIEASGGAAAYARAKSVAMEGAVEIEGRNIAGTVSIAQAGRKSYTSMDLAGIGKVEEGYDGEIGWQNSALQGPRLLDGQEKAVARRASSLSMITAWRDEYTSAKTLGSEDIAGKPAWKVEMTPKEGKPENFFFDRESGLMAAVGMILPTPLGDMATQVMLADYRLVDGIQTPFRMTQQAFGQSIVMTFSKVSYNAQIPASRFELPDAVKALAAKQK
jgi:hypothetical protein